MKARHLPGKIAGAILGLTLLLGIGVGLSTSADAQGRYGNQDRRNRDWDGYPNWGGSFDLRQTALNAGYNEGTKEGRNDRSDYWLNRPFLFRLMVFCPVDLRPDAESWDYLENALFHALLRRPEEGFLCRREPQG